jgi:hypothetical protein
VIPASLTAVYGGMYPQLLMCLQKENTEDFGEKMDPDSLGAGL